MINWHLFSKAITAYEQLGYKLIEVPWLVDQETIKVTLPPQCKPFTVDGCGSLNQLVGSAEQSFIYLALQGKLSNGKYMALTPCFRDDKEDEWHHKYFLKLK
jgi:seryl-tRNA synthetase